MAIHAHLAHLKKIQIKNLLLFLVLCVIAGAGLYYISVLNKQATVLSESNTQLSQQLDQTKKSLDTTTQDLEKMKTRDEFKINNELEAEINSIKKTYNAAVVEYEELIKLREQKVNTSKLEDELTKALVELSKKDYKAAETTLVSLRGKIATEKTKLIAAAAAVVIPANVPQDNSPPGSGYKRQSVATDFGTFMVDIIAADLNSSRVIVDTASDSDCANDCPVASLGTYASRSGGFAGINGPYFCPASYPSCDGKKNSFDTLLMNKNKFYFNSANNVYSNVPAVIFAGSSVRYVGSSAEWGRDTGVDAVIANQPLMVIGGNVVFGGDEEAKRASSGTRSFIGNTGSTVYIGVVHGASVAQAARVVKALGIQNAINLDSGGSTALWNGGRYIVGPGRDTPFGIIITGR